MFSKHLQGRQDSYLRKKKYPCVTPREPSAVSLQCARRGDRHYGTKDWTDPRGPVRPDGRVNGSRCVAEMAGDCCMAVEKCHGWPVLETADRKGGRR